MSDPKEAIKFVLENEDAALSGRVTYDAGGATRWGIAQKYHPNVDVANLTLEQAEQIYVQEYWDPRQLGDIVDQDTANRVVDCLVNPGPEAGAKVVQEAVNEFQRNKITVDGAIGPETVKAINAVNPADFLPELRATRCMYYVADAAAHPAQAEYLRGWLRRACR